MTKWLGWSVLAGCAYHAGSFADRKGVSPGAHTTLGCLDLAIAQAQTSDAGTVVDYFVGNRCDQRLTFDLAHVHIIGRSATGTEVALTAYDPRNELSPQPLAARWSGRARIEYRGAEPVVSICAEVAGVELVPRAKHWVCMEGSAP